MNWKHTLVIAALGLAMGCVHKGPYVPKSEPEAAAENRETLVVLGEELSEKIAVEGQQAKSLEDGRLQVFANIRNRTKKRVVVQVQTVFKDEHNFSTGDETAWQEIVITDLSQTTYQSVSQNDKAKKYTIRVRSVR